MQKKKPKNFKFNQKTKKQKNYIYFDQQSKQQMRQIFQVLILLFVCNLTLQESIQSQLSTCITNNCNGDVNCFEGIISMVGCYEDKCSTSSSSDINQAVACIKQNTQCTQNQPQSTVNALETCAEQLLANNSLSQLQSAAQGSTTGSNIIYFVFGLLMITL
ncbi:hypothetical protein TTHERM_00096670 (macronuclear) [Tetrahymena thermophila SB210]|uniref:Uncharacterized protein n=1 Tax=Tetrahymena thermophila (strain SB210) TaxID=312017 RepID=Q234Y1_TETTS|nr:hypothetical protein TTHERM_00096670 [Tetrahymena thermophila SB210]EAR91872.2 hypothetical protein TTHERM_00096670 [Tetrahymena thermophila SB210]|eukprot:XP_001012117.2 hypothetical protein TTHERM_00096670 [Tetrahymena thermophila SB210]